MAMNDMNLSARAYDRMFESVADDLPDLAGAKRSDPTCGDGVQYRFARSALWTMKGKWGAVIFLIVYIVILPFFRRCQAFDKIQTDRGIHAASACDSREDFRIIRASPNIGTLRAA